VSLMTSLPDVLARQLRSAGETLITAFLAVAAATALCFIGIAVLAAVADWVHDARERYRALAAPHISSLDLTGPWCGRS